MSLRMRARVLTALSAIDQDVMSDKDIATFRAASHDPELLTLIHDRVWLLRPEEATVEDHVSGAIQTARSILCTHAGLGEMRPAQRPRPSGMLGQWWRSQALPPSVMLYGRDEMRNAFASAYVEGRDVVGALDRLIDPSTGTVPVTTGFLRLPQPLLRPVSHHVAQFQDLAEISSYFLLLHTVSVVQRESKATKGRVLKRSTSALLDALQRSLAQVQPIFAAFSSTPLADVSHAEADAELPRDGGKMEPNDPKYPADGTGTRLKRKADAVEEAGASKTRNGRDSRGGVVPAGVSDGADKCSQGIINISVTHDADAPAGDVPEAAGAQHRHSRGLAGPAANPPVPERQRIVRSRKMAIVRVGRLSDAATTVRSSGARESKPVPRALDAPATFQEEDRRLEWRLTFQSKVTYDRSLPSAHVRNVVKWRLEDKLPFSGVAQMFRLEYPRVYADSRQMTAFWGRVVDAFAAWKDRNHWQPMIADGLCLKADVKSVGPIRPDGDPAIVAEMIHWSKIFEGADPASVIREF